MQLYEEPPESKGSYILQGEDPHSRNLSPPLASMRLPSPSETAAQAEALWRLFTFQMGQQQGRCLRSGHGQRNGLTAGLYIPKDGSRKGSSSHLQGRRYKRGESQLKTNFGKKCVPPSGIDEAPLTIGDSSASGSPLEALSLIDRATVRQMLTERTRPTERPR